MSVNTLEMLRDCEEAVSCSNHPFTKWEEDFVESVSEQFAERGSLPEKQIETLERIWEKI